MTKDGRPSRLRDIRIFSSTPLRYLEGHREAWAFAKRLAWYLNGEQFSIGAHTSLYLRLSSSLSVGSVVVTDEGGDWWQRYTDVGAPRDVSDDADGRAFVEQCTIDALTANRPDLAHVVDHAAACIRAHGRAMRFPVKRRQTKKYNIEVSFSVGAFDVEPSQFHVMLEDRATHELFDAAPANLLMPEEAFDLAGGVSLSHLGPLEKIATHPPTSKLVARRS